MKLTSLVVPLLSALPSAHAWGALGHETVGFIASNFVTTATKTYCQGLLGSTTTDYLAAVATYADAYRETTAGKWSAPLHFIDAEDSPPQTCNVDYSRDCGSSGCVVSAINNYTTRLGDGRFSQANHAEALKFLVHFVGDIHQPLHDENLDVGGNDIDVTFDGTKTNLHAVWDTSMLQKFAGTATLANAQAYASTLTTRIKSGAYESMAAGWLDGIDVTDPVTTATGWATDANAHVCTTVMPNGISAVEDTDLSGAYYTGALPVAEQMLAMAGYRLAAWLNLIVTGDTGL